MLKPKAIIVDLDGTLCDLSHRVHHVEKKPQNWKAFYHGIEGDELNQWCYEILIRFHQSGTKILLVTGRDEAYRQSSIDWLKKYQVPFERLWMRGLKDNRPDDLVKEQIYLDNIENEFDVLFVLDDRLSVVKKWRELGLICLQCDWGDF